MLITDLETRIVAMFFGFTLTAFGLFNTLIFSKFNEAMKERKSIINRQISESEALLRSEEIQRNRVFEQRRRLLELNSEFLREYVGGLKYIPQSINQWGIFSLAFFLLEFLILLFRGLIPITVENYIALFVLSGPFLAGLIFLVLYIIQFYRHIKIYLSLFKIKKPKGKLSFVQINGEEISDDIKEVRMNFRCLPDVFEVRVKLDGDFLNGFIDSHYIYLSRIRRRFESVWIPDPVSYLSRFWYRETGLSSFPELDTGILQKNIHEGFTLDFRLRNFPAVEDYRGYRLRPEDQIERIEIDVFEDPWHLPNTERRNIKSEKLTIINEAYQGQQT